MGALEEEGRERSGIVGWLSVGRCASRDYEIGGRRR